LKEKGAGKRLEAVISDQLAAQMCIARVGDEVTNILIKQCSRAVTEGREVRFFYEIAERVFVLRHNLRYTKDVGFNNLEVVGNAHIRRLKNTTKERRQSAPFGYATATPLLPASRRYSRSRAFSFEAASSAALLRSAA